MIIGICTLTWLKVYTDQIKQEFNTSIACPEKVTKLDAWVDQQKPDKERIGFMHCFCLSKLASDPAGFINIRFESVDPTSPEPKYYCKDWAYSYFTQRFLVFGTSVIIVIINVVICFIFELISRVEKHHTQNEQTLATFAKITVLQFINISLIVLLINFTIPGAEQETLLGILPVLRGEYSDFTVQWYHNVGATLCVTLTISIISVHIGKMLWCCLRASLRCRDRGCVCHLKRLRNNPSDTMVNTRLQT